MGRDAVIKQRFSKQYRHPVLDAKLIAGRLNQVCCGARFTDLHTICWYSVQFSMQEVRSMLRARKAGILTPVIYSVQHEAATIFMERVDGFTVKETLLSGTLSEEGNTRVTALLLMSIV